MLVSSVDVWLPIALAPPITSMAVNTSTVGTTPGTVGTTPGTLGTTPGTLGTVRTVRTLVSARPAFSPK